jgi:hypothetical protein
VITEVTVDDGAMASGDLSPLDEAMEKAARRPEIARQMQGKLFLHLPGDGTVPYASQAAEALRGYIRAAFARYPHLLYFLPRDKDTQGLVVAAHGRVAEAPDGTPAVALDLDGMLALRDALVAAAAFAATMADDAAGIVAGLIDAGALPPTMTAIVLGRAEGAP